ncbi:hypothetical protein [Streptomyces corynorhini]|uniref:Uncharacterized protein n=1 Tax=Streptomyces corynorhini TaxID=2282652 RepID=A0A370BA08_9ACTN|nr:hypothetical protein [Streptomyces corynorhini]RDG36633.1 hypothetical protein DVH02_18640 [Streptomyces corynorhini]
MTVLPQLLNDVASLTVTAGLLYGGVVAVVALTSVLAPSPERRRDARSTLNILVRKRRSG